MKRRYYVNQKIILDKTLRYATIVKYHIDGIQYLVSYYDSNNKVQHLLVRDDDILTPEQYELIKVRNNTILDILK